jgi:hypothetical protein
MKIIHLFVLVLLLINTACKNEASANKIDNTATNSALVMDADNPATDGEKGAVILFEEEKHDFGNLIQGEKVFYSFKFKNTGVGDLIISTARGSCGCTVPTYSKKPIKPGAEGKIDIVFNSGNLQGISQKTITVLSNSEPDGIKILTIRSNVIAPDVKRNKE